MRWSWRIGRVAGVGISVHATFPLLLAWIAVAMLGTGAAPGAVLSAVALTLAVFLMVVLHELGHALTARRFGIRTVEITLLPIGGVARMERLARDPRQELAITLAGPLVNVAIAAVLYAALAATGGADRVRELLAEGAPTSPRAVLAQLMALSLWLAVFNLVPAFPLDGGRVLRALLAMRSGDYARATLAAARVGRAFALLFALGGVFLFANPFLVAIALFVWLSAAAEANAAQTSAALDQVSLASLMITDVRTLVADDPLARAAELTIAGFQQDFPVVEAGALVGMLSQGDLVRGLTKLGSDAPVRAAMRTEFRTAAPEDAPEEALRRLGASDCGSLPIVRGGRLLGLLTMDNVREYLLLRSAQAHGTA